MIKVTVISAISILLITSNIATAKTNVPQKIKKVNAKKIVKSSKKAIPKKRKVTASKRHQVKKKLKPVPEKQQSSKGKFGLSAKVGTLGLGLDLSYGINDKLNARINFNGASADIEKEEEGKNVAGKLTGQTFGGLIDYHPMAGSFRISAGLYHNGNELDLDITGKNDDVKIGDKRYDLTGASLNTNLGFKSMAPYLGLGWGNAVNTTGSKWSFSSDFGVLFQGSPEIKLTASGNAKDLSSNQTININTDPVFQAELEKETSKLNKDAKDFKFYPVISLGASYRF